MSYKKFVPIGSPVLTFIGYKQTNTQTDKQIDKPNLHINLEYPLIICFGDENHACVRNKWSETKLKSCYFMGLWEKDLIGDNSMSI